MSGFAQRIRSSVLAELEAAALADASGDAATAFGHLERAHVLGQAATAEHVRVHWQMLRWAMRHHRRGEALGQLWRLAGASESTWCGWVPHGKTGGTNVSGLRRKSVPPELQRVIVAAHR